MKYPGIAAGVHGLRKNQAIEFAVVFRLADDDARFVWLTVRCSRNQILLCLIVVLRVDVFGRDLDVLRVIMRVHEGFEERTGTSDFNRRRNGRHDLFHGLGCGFGATLPTASTAATLALSTSLCGVLSGYRNRRLSKDDHCSDRENEHDRGYVSHAFLPASIWSLSKREFGNTKTQNSRSDRSDRS